MFSCSALYTSIIRRFRTYNFKVLAQLELTWVWWARDGLENLVNNIHNINDVPATLYIYIDISRFTNGLKLEHLIRIWKLWKSHGKIIKSSERLNGIIISRDDRPWKYFIFRFYFTRRVQFMKNVCDFYSKFRHNIIDETYFIDE